jgi:drug/metabolite transporter (DMT)-like permease
LSHPTPSASPGAGRDVPLVLAMLAVVSLWGGTYSGIKALQATIPPLGLAGGRAMASALALVGVTLALRIRGPRPTWPDVRALVLLGLTGTTAFQLCLVGGVFLTTPSHTALMITLNPVFAAVLARLWLGEALSRTRASGILLALTGVVLITTRGSGLDGGALVGNLIGLGAALAWAVYSVLAKPLLARRPALEVSALTLLIGSVPLFLLGLPDLLAVAWTALPARTWILLAYLSFGAIGAGYTIWYWALARAATARVVVFTYLTPVIAVLVSVGTGQEPMTAVLAAGAIAVIGGVVVTQLG